MPRTERTCPICGNIHWPLNSEIAKGWGVFCSRKCATENQKIPIEEKFWSKVQRTDGCWIWQGAKHLFGYGVIWTTSHKQLLLAHRVSWELHNGKIPDGLGVLHRCDTPPCINPAHLFLGTHSENFADMWGKGRGVIPPQGPGRSGGRKVGGLSMTTPAILRRLQRKRSQA